MLVVGPADLVSVRAVGGCTVPAGSNDPLQHTTEHSQADQAPVKICVRKVRKYQTSRGLRSGERCYRRNSSRKAVFHG